MVFNINWRQQICVLISKYYMKSEACIILPVSHGASTLRNKNSGCIQNMSYEIASLQMSSKYVHKAFCFVFLKDFFLRAYVT